MRSLSACLLAVVLLIAACTGQRRVEPIVSGFRSDVIVKDGTVVGLHLRGTILASTGSKHTAFRWDIPSDILEQVPSLKLSNPPSFPISEPPSGYSPLWQGRCVNVCDRLVLDNELSLQQPLSTALGDFVRQRINTGSVVSVQWETGDSGAIHLQTFEVGSAK